MRTPLITICALLSLITAVPVSAVEAEGAASTEQLAKAAQCRT